MIQYVKLDMPSASVHSCLLGKQRNMQTDEKIINVGMKRSVATTGAQMVWPMMGHQGCS